MNIVHSNLYSVVFISWKRFMFARGGDCVTKSVTFDLINCVQTVFNAVCFVSVLPVYQWTRIFCSGNTVCWLL